MNRKLWIALAALVLFGAGLYVALGYEPAPMTRGEFEARIDIAHGRYKELTYGLPVMWFPTYQHLLRERYGVEVHPVAGCVVSDSLIAYIQSYNQVSTAAINKKFGRDVFKESADEASRQWNEMAKKSETSSVPALP